MATSKEELRDRFRKAQSDSIDLSAVMEAKIPLDQRLELLKEHGREDLAQAIKGWKPRVSRAKKRGAPLDQRVSITVTGDERFSLDKSLKQLKNEKTSISMSQYIRNRAMGSVDIHAWREIAVRELEEIENISANATDLRRKKSQLIVQIEDEDDKETTTVLEYQVADINHKLEKITAQNRQRTHRLAGRMSMSEAETVKWRAQRLCLSSSDYLRMMIFGHLPASDADSHMSLDAKRRFYLSIIDVADNGWGEVPKIYNCSQCENYMDEIRRLQEMLRNNEKFANAGA